MAQGSGTSKAGAQKATAAKAAEPTDAGTTTAAGSNVLPDHGDHDRVAMLSLRADGAPDQLRPEMIGPQDATRAATREQFTQQAVSAEDVRLRGVVSDTGGVLATDGDGKPVEAPQDPSIVTLTEAHDAAAESARSAADAAVDALHSGLGDSPGNTATAGPAAGERPPVDKP